MEYGRSSNSPVLPVRTLSAPDAGSSKPTSRNQPGRIYRFAFPITVALLFLAVGGLYAFSICFSQFSFYDDEGFVMISVRGFLEGHSLYDEVYTAYGPFYYFCQWLFHSFTTLPVSHDVTRSLCVFNWLATSVILGSTGALLTRSAWVGFLVFIQAMAHLTPVAREPGHPQELVALLLACSAFLLALDLKPNWKFFGLGAICAALTFTKVNVGAFFAVALVLTLALTTPAIRLRPFLLWTLLALLSLLPFLLLRLHLDRDWARQFAWLVCASTFCLGMASVHSDQRRGLGLSEWLQAGAAFACASVLLLGFVLAFGSSVPAVVDCLVVSPSKIAGQFWGALYVPNAYWSAVASLFAAFLWLRKPTGGIAFSAAFTTAKFVFGILGAFLLFDSSREQLGYLMPWLWLALIQVPSKEGTARDCFPRMIICFVAAWETLQAYPVAGTQAAIGTLLLVLPYSLCLHDAIVTVSLQPWAKHQLGTFLKRTAVVQTLLLLFLLDIFAFRWCWPNWLCERYRLLEPLGMPGAQHLRIPGAQAEEYRTLTQYLKKECDSFITYPGVNSLYFWSGKEPPSYFNVAEIILLSDRQQFEVMKAFSLLRRPLVVINERAVPRNVSEGPLLKFMREQCVEIGQIGTFRILSPNKEHKPVSPSLHSAAAKKLTPATALI